MEKKPYKENINGNVIIRTFSENVDSGELTWHRDHEDRLVIALNETDWMIQFDNDLPRRIKVNETITIPKNTFHRVIKGTGELNVKIVEGDLSKGLKIIENISKFDKNYLKMRLHETFNDNAEPMIEPQINPEVKPAPDKVQPNIAPSRKNKPFLPIREVKPDPKAEI